MKRFFLLMLAGCLLFSVTACGAKTEPTPEPAPEPTPEPTPEPAPEPAPAPEPEPEPAPKAEPILLPNGQTQDPDLWDTLTEKQKETRMKVVRYMEQMANLEWTPSVDIFYDDFGNMTSVQARELGFTGTPYYSNYRTKYEFKAGTVYHGLPYTHQFGNYEKMAQYVDKNGVFRVEDLPDDFGTKTENMSEWNGWMGWDCYAGTDCSGSVYSAWSQVSTVYFDSTGGEMPGKNGCLAVGEYESNGLTKPSAVIAANDPQVMCEAYAKLLPGDAVVHDGHTRLVASSAVVVRNPDGTIDPEASYVLIHDIQRSIRDFVEYDGTVHTNTQWRLNQKNTFATLLTGSGGDIPLTNKVLQSGEAPEPTITFKNLGVNSGTVSSNGYRLLSFHAVVTDKNGKTMWDYTHYVVGTDLSDARFHRSIQFKDAKFSVLGEEWGMSGVKYEPNETYTYTMTVRLSCGYEQSESVTFLGKDAPATNSKRPAPAAPNTVRAVAPAAVTTDANNRTLFSPMKAFTEKEITVFVDDAWKTLPLAEKYSLSNASGTTENGKPNANSLYKIVLTDGKVTSLTQLVYAMGYQSVFTKDAVFTVSTIKENADGSKTIDVTGSNGGSNFAGLTIPKALTVIDENGASPIPLAVGDTIRTAYFLEDAGKNVPVLYIVTHANPIPDLSTNRTFFSPMKAFTEAEITVFTNGAWTNLPLADSYELSNASGTTKNGKPNQNSLYEIVLTDGKVTKLTQLVMAMGYQSIFTKDVIFTVSELKTNADGSQTATITSSDGRSYAGLAIPKTLAVIDENGLSASPLSVGDTVRTAYAVNDPAPTLKVLYIVTHANPAAPVTPVTPPPAPVAPAAVKDGVYYSRTTGGTSVSVKIFVDGGWYSLPLETGYTWTHADGTTNISGGLYRVTVSRGAVTALDQLVSANGYQSCVNYLIREVTIGSDGRAFVKIANEAGTTTFDVILPADLPVTTAAEPVTFKDLHVGDKILTAYDKSDANHTVPVFFVSVPAAG